MCFQNVEKSKNGQGSLWLSKCYCASNDTASCFMWLRKHLESAQRAKESEIMLDPTFDKLQQTRSWKDLWQTDWYNSIDKTIAEAEYYNKNGNYDLTIELLNQRIRGKKSRTALYELRGDAYFALQNTSAAATDYKIALRKSKNQPIYLVKIAQTLAERSQIQPALKKIDEAIAKAGNNPVFYLTRAQILFKNGMCKEAYPDLKYYLSFYPNSTSAMELFVQSAIESGHYVDALLSLAKLIKLYPNNAQLLYLRGITLLKTEQPRLAIPDFDLAIQQSYNITEAYYNKALALIAIGNTAEACQCLSIAIQYGCFKAQELQYKYCKK